MPSMAHSPTSFQNQSSTRPDRELRMDGYSLPSEPPTAKAILNGGHDTGLTHPHAKVINAQKIYIGGLPEITRSEDLQDCFSQLGKILTIELKTGYGFVEFDNPQSATDAVTKYHEGHFLGAQIKVEISHGGSRPRHVAVAANPEACYSCGVAGHRARDCQEADPALQRRPIRPRSRSPLPIRDELPIRQTRDHYDPSPREDPRHYPERLRPADPLPVHRERDRYPPVIESRRDDDRRDIRRDDDRRDIRRDDRLDDRRVDRRVDRRDERPDERRDDRREDRRFERRDDRRDERPDGRRIDRRDDDRYRAEPPSSDFRERIDPRGLPISSREVYIPPSASAASFPPKYDDHLRHDYHSRAPRPSSHAHLTPPRDPYESRAARYPPRHPEPLAPHSSFESRLGAHGEPERYPDRMPLEPRGRIDRRSPRISDRRLEPSYPPSTRERSPRRSSRRSLSPRRAAYPASSYRFHSPPPMRAERVVRMSPPPASYGRPIHVSSRR